MDPKLLEREELEYEAKIRGIYEARKNIRTLRNDIAHRIVYEMNHNSPSINKLPDDINIHDELNTCYEILNEIATFSTNPKKHSELLARGNHLLLRFNRIDMNKINNIDLYQLVHRKLADFKKVMDEVSNLNIARDIIESGTNKHKQ